MSKVIDLTGQTFNYWTVIKRMPNNNRGESMWLCQCKCGTQKVIQGYSLRKGLSKSCGCLQKEIVSKMKLEDLTGQKFGHLTVIKQAGKDNSNKVMWECECDCQAKTKITARTNDLKSGKTTSCGCVKSLGEEKISLLLMEANIPFIKEKTFDSCRFPDTNALARFDFFVNNSYIIEYDGIQHFKPTYNELNPKTFSNTLSHDDYKNNWCKENNIPIIRINYKQLKTLTIKDLTL